MVMCVISSLFPAFQTIEDHEWSTYKDHKLACFKKKKKTKQKHNRNTASWIAAIEM